MAKLIKFPKKQKLKKNEKKTENHKDVYLIMRRKLMSMLK